MFLRQHREAAARRQRPSRYGIQQLTANRSRTSANILAGRELALAAPFGVGAAQRACGQSRPLRMKPPNRSQFPVARSNMRLAADIGGTFTDVAAFDAATGELKLGKALSTPHRLVEGITVGIEKAGTTYAAAGLFLHGSTVAINTIFERTGAKTALIITEGFRDIYEIGRINRPDAYNLFFKKHVPLVERAL